MAYTQFLCADINTCKDGLFSVHIVLNFKKDLSKCLQCVNNITYLTNYIIFLWVIRCSFAWCC